MPLCRCRADDAQGPEVRQGLQLRARVRALLVARRVQLRCLVRRVRVVGILPAGRRVRAKLARGVDRSDARVVELVRRVRRAFTVLLLLLEILAVLRVRLMVVGRVRCALGERRRVEDDVLQAPLRLAEKLLRALVALVVRSWLTRLGLVNRKHVDDELAELGDDDGLLGELEHGAELERQGLSRRRPLKVAQSA